jgi:hypothetical protein
MRTIYRTGFPIARVGNSDTLAAAAGVCLNWVLQRPGIAAEHRKLSKDVLRSLVHTPIGTGHAIETRLLERNGNRAWAMRFKHPHREGNETDEQIEWQTEIGISEKADSLTFCCSISVGRSDSAVAPVKFFPTRPRVVLELLKKFSCGGKVKLSDKPYVLKDQPADAQLFRALLETDSRQLPVVFITPRVPGGDYATDYWSVASQLAGLAYVVVANCPQATRLLANELPAQLNCYNGGVRVYWPGFNVSQSPYAHPLWLWWKIRQFQEKHPAAFAKELLKRISSVAVLSLHPDWLTWSDVESHERAQAIERAKSAGDTEELLNLYVKDKEVLEAIVKQLKAQLEAKSRDLQVAQSKISAYEAAFAQAKQYGVERVDEAELLPPTTVEEAVERAKKLFGNRLIFALNAKSKVEGSAFEEPEELMKALSWLATAYFDSKTGVKSGKPLRDSIKESLPDWFYSGGQCPQTVGAFKEWYHCQFENRKWELGEHIGTGKSKDARHTIRVGFTWDRDGKRVIVGFIGQHQRNRQT